MKDKQTKVKKIKLRDVKKLIDISFESPERPWIVTSKFISISSSRDTIYEYYYTGKNGIFQQFQELTNKYEIGDTIK